MLMILSILLILMLFQFILMLYLYLRTVNDVTEGRPNQEIPVGNSWWFPSNSSGILWEISNGSSWWFSGNDSTVRPWHARFFGGNGKTCVAQNSCNLSYLQNYDKGKSIKKLCSLRFSLNKFVHFWPYSKTCIVKVHAAWGHISRGLTVVRM